MITSVAGEEGSLWNLEGNLGAVFAAMPAGVALGVAGSDPPPVDLVSMVA